MTTSRDHGGDPLEEALLRPPYLDGPEFTRRVMSRLPPPRRRARALVLAAGGLLSGAAAAALLSRSAEALGPALLGALSGRLPAAEALAALGAACALGLTAGLLAAAELRGAR